jgi:hypothetical protein
VASWAAGRTWVSGETVTASQLNEQLRDRPDYTKEVIDGTSKQDVTINAARALLHGTQAVMRGSGSTKQHVEMVSISKAVGIGGTEDISATWAKAFSSAPKCAIGLTSYHADGCSAMIYSVSTTGCTIRCRAGATAMTVTADIIALGPD